MKRRERFKAELKLQCHTCWARPGTPCIWLTPLGGVKQKKRFHKDRRERYERLEKLGAYNSDISTL